MRPHTEQACSNSEEEKLPLNRKKLPAQPQPDFVQAPISVMTDRFEKTEQMHKK